MSVTSGFFNSLNHDRRYNAQQMSSIFDGVINDGVFANIGVAFKVTAAGGVTVNIGEGKAWFNSAWVYNDTVLPLTFEASEVVLDRIDAIAIDVDHNESVRSGTIKIVKGTPSSSPKRPTMVSDKKHKQAPLVYIYRKAGSTEITQADITNMVGTSECPYITGILQVQNIDNIVAQWGAQWNQWYANKTAETNSDASELLAEMKSDFDIWFDYIQALLSERIIEADSDTSELLARMQSEFDIWFNDFKAVLDDDVATALAAKVADLQSRFDTLAKERAVYDTIEDSDLDVIIGSDGTPIRGKTVFGTGSSSSGGDDACLPLTGGEMLGPIRGLDTPIYDDQAVNKGYVDAGLADAKDYAKDYADDQIMNRVILSGSKNLIDTKNLYPFTETALIKRNESSITVYNNVASEFSGFNTLDTVRLKAGHRYIISVNVFSYTGTVRVGVRTAYAYPDLSFTKGKILFSAYATKTGRIRSDVYTAPADLDVCVAIFSSGSPASTGSIECSDIMLEEGTVATAFEPYYIGIAELSSNMDLLWENASPTSVFPGTEVSVDYREYKELEVYFCMSTTDISNTVNTRFKVNDMNRMITSMLDGSFFTVVRNVHTRTTKNTLWIGGCSGIKMSITPTIQVISGDAANDRLIPLKISGIK